MSSAFTIEIPISFDLATGPFRIFDIDIKEAYRLAKRLYDALQSARDVAEIMADIAEFLGTLESAADVAAAVSTIAPIIWNAEC